MVTSQEKEKTCFTFKVSQWNQTFSPPSHFGPFLLDHLAQNLHFNVKGNRHFSITSKAEKQKWRYKVLFRQQRYICYVVKKALKYGSIYGGDGNQTSTSYINISPDARDIFMMGLR